VRQVLPATGAGKGRWQPGNRLPAAATHEKTRPDFPPSATLSLRFNCQATQIGPCLSPGSAAVCRAALKKEDPIGLVGLLNLNRRRERRG